MAAIPIRRRTSEATSVAARLAGAHAKTRTVDIDALVSAYAPKGRQQRLTARRRQVTTVIALPLVVALAAAGFWGARSWILDGDPTVARQLAELTTLKDEINAERREWQQERLAFQQQSVRLLQQLADLNAQRQALDQQRLAFESRQSELQAALGRLDEQSRQLDRDQLKAKRQGPNLDRQVADLKRQRQELDQQRQEFRSQSTLVAQELKDLDAQRRDLEGQQQALELQRRELQALMERYEKANRPAEPQAGEGAQTGDGGVAREETAMLASNTVSDTVLGEMRGGIRLDGLDISFGLTRSASINGVEQFTNSYHIENLADLASGIAVAPAQLAVIQQGLGNTIDLGAMDAMSGNVGTVIQNTLDNQHIDTMTVIDISLHNASSIVSGITASDAISQSLSMHQ
jgi:hypothetical protein